MSMRPVKCVKHYLIYLCLHLKLIIDLRYHRCDSSNQPLSTTSSGTRQITFVPPLSPDTRERRNDLRTNIFKRCFSAGFHRHSFYNVMIIRKHLTSVCNENKFLNRKGFFDSYKIQITI